MNKTLRRTIVPAICLAIALGACAKDSKGLGDAPVSQAPDKEVLVTPNADQYPNVAFFCIGPNGVYTTTREVPPVVVQDDANCEVGDGDSFDNPAGP